MRNFISANKTKIILQIAGFAVLVLVLILLIALYNKNREESAESAAKEAKSEFVKDWNTYENPEDGFLIKYPAQYGIEFEFQNEELHTLIFAFQGKNSTAVPELNLVLSSDPLLTFNQIKDGYRLHPGIAEKERTVLGITGKEFGKYGTETFIVLVLPHQDQDRIFLLSLTSPKETTKEDLLLFDLFVSTFLLL